MTLRTLIARCLGERDALRYVPQCFGVKHHSSGLLL
jgi:hypothetical protein